MPRSTSERTASRRSELSPATRPRRQIRLLFWLIGLGVVLLAVGWLTGAFAAIPLQRVERALARHQELRAEQYLVWAERLRAPAATTELLRARIARRQSDFKAMSQHLQAAVKAGAARREVEHEELLAAAQSGQLDEIEPRLKAWLAEPGNDGIEICEAYCNGLTMLGRLEDAQVILHAWQADRPDDPEPHFRRGRIFEHLLNYEEAEQEYRLALEKDPEYPSVLYALGRLLLDRKRPEEALELFQRCEQAIPVTAPAARVGIAMSLRALGKIDAAREMLTELVNGDPQAREQAYNRVRFLPPSDPATFELGKLESEEGNYAAAEKWLERTVAANPQDLDARYAWAVSLRGIGRKEESQREFEHVSKVRKILAETDRLYDRLGEQPDDVEARYQLGLAYLQYRSEKVGLYWLQSVLNYDPAHAATHRTLAEWYETHAHESEAYQRQAEFHRQQLDAVPEGSQKP